MTDLDLEKTEREAAASAPETAPEGPGAPPEQAAPEQEDGQTPGAVRRDPEARAGEQARPDPELVMRIPVTVQAVLGQARMSIARLMKLGPGAVVALDHKVGEPVDVVVNGKLVARGEVVLLEEDSERFGISLTEIVRPGGEAC